MTLKAFFPNQGGAVSISASTSSANTAITVGQRSLYLANASDVVIFVKVGVGTQTATSADFPLLPNAAEVISIRPEHDNVAALAQSGSTKILYACPGAGS